MENKAFELASQFVPSGDQPAAIDTLVRGLNNDLPRQVLKGITGSGKTFTMANVIAQTNRPSIVLAPNKTLAAQLYREFKELFPNNAVEYFVSYYDYYQPEAYIASSSTYIEKESDVNEQLDRLRLSSTKSILSRHDTIIVASISCIYGIGSPLDFHNMVLFLREGDIESRDKIMDHLVEIQYTRNNMDFYQGTFRVRGEIIDIFPAYEERKAIRIQLFGDEIESLHEIDPLTGKEIARISNVKIYPASVYVSEKEKRKRAMKTIEAELQKRLEHFRKENKLVELQRLEQRTLFDLEMMQEMGTCAGIENYSRHFTERSAGEPPYTLIDYFPDDFLLFIDESHIAVPQSRAMYNGDRSRKETLVEFGFRLPSALDNRPLKFEEFQGKQKQTIYVSATPGEFELDASQGIVIEQVVRPTGLMDPQIEVRPATGQVEDLLGELRAMIAKGSRVLVTTLTKRMSEELNEYVNEVGIKAKYLHSDIDAIERTELLKALRLGEFDVLIGINLLREGLDLPEVELVAILDADKEGFLRSEVSLIQTCGRAARNVDGHVIMYGDRITRSMQATIDETQRRREKQKEYNKEHGITPQSIKKDIKDILESVYEKDYVEVAKIAEGKSSYGRIAFRKLPQAIKQTKKDMKTAAKEMDFEKAIQLRDRLFDLERQFMEGSD